MSALNVCGPISLICFLAATFFWLRHLPPENPIARLIASLLILPAQLIAAGQILSLFNQLANPTLWLCFSLFFLLLAYFSTKKINRQKTDTNTLASELKTLYADLQQSQYFTKIIFCILAPAVLVTICLNIFSMCTAAPSNAACLTADSTGPADQRNKI